VENRYGESCWRGEVRTIAHTAKRDLDGAIMVLRKSEFGLVPEFRIPRRDFGCKSLIFIEAENGTEIA
jgi:hypothetical protein